MCELEQTYPLDVAASVLSHGRTARLIDDLRERRHLVNAISASNMTFGNQGVFYISAQVLVANLAEAEAAILEHIQRLHEAPVTADELHRVQTQVANLYILAVKRRAIAPTYTATIRPQPATFAMRLTTQNGSSSEC